jgi:pyruvate carboxylase
MEGAANAHLSPVRFSEEVTAFQTKFGNRTDDKDYLSFKMYPKVYAEYHAHNEEFGDVSRLPTPLFYYGLKPNEEVLIQIAEGKTLLIKYLDKTETDAEGNVVVFFRYNGTSRSISVQDKSVKVATPRNKKAESSGEIGAPLQGSIGSIFVKEGDPVAVNQPLFTLEAMKMESTIASPLAGKVTKVLLKEKTLVHQGDAVLEIQ